MTQYKTINYEFVKGVAILTLNRPDSLNSFTAKMHEEVREVLAEVKNNKLIRCFLITGSGRGFCAGQDLTDRSVQGNDTPQDLGDSVEKNYNPLIKSIMNLEKPVVCAVNGVAAGAGASLALACDIVIAARSAKFIQAFCKIGLIPDSGGTFNLPRALGLPRAKGLALLGDRLSAEQAENWGLIWQCTDDDQLMLEANKLTQHLAIQPTQGLAAIKKMLNHSFNHSLDQQLELEKSAMRRLGKTEDYREGVAAFMEKRNPLFKGE